MDAFIKGEQEGITLTGYRDVTHHRDVLSVLHSQELAGLVRGILEEAPATFNVCAWHIRACLCLSSFQNNPSLRH